MAVPLSRRRFTVDDYHRMAEAGIFDEDDRVELIEGEIVEMSAMRGPHINCVVRTTKLFGRRFDDVADVGVQISMRLDQRNEPQPDIVLLRPGFESDVPPGPQWVFLVVEISDTTVKYDRQIKAPLYARHGIVEYWLVDLKRETITAYRDPSETGYRTSQPFRRGERLAPFAFPDREVAIDEILGPRANLKR